MNPASQTSEVQTGHATGVIISIDLKWAKFQKIFFSVTMRHTDYIFIIWQCLVVPYINSANQAPGAQTCHFPGVIGSHRLLMGKHKINLLL